MSVLGRRVDRATLGDALLVAGAAVVVFGGSPRAARLQVPPRIALDGRAYALLALAVAGLALRRRHPLPTLAVTVGATALYLGLGYPYGPVLFTMGIGTFAVANQVPLLRSLAACLIALAVALLAVVSTGLARPTPHASGWLAAWSAWLLVPWTAGTVRRLRREAAARAAAAAAQRSVYEERLRIAREVHDVVGHGLAVINMQAGVALHVLDRRPEQARMALEAVKQTSKDALDELRATLAVFRQREPAGDGPAPAAGGAGSGGTAVGGAAAGGMAAGEAGSGGAGSGGTAADGAGTGGTAAGGAGTGGAGGPVGPREPARQPAPGLGQLDALVGSMRDAGLPVELLRTGAEVPLPAVVDHAAYRIVQESLTNVLRHALPASARVWLSYRPDEVLVKVTDDGAPKPAPRAAAGAAGGGHGIAGMRERAEAVGGELSAGPLPGRGFEVTARLPAGPGDPAGGRRRRPGGTA